jgi:hypothetical protein
MSMPILALQCLSIVCSLKQPYVLQGYSVRPYDSQDGG